jgi:excisionase family DNA binding protein
MTIPEAARILDLAPSTLRRQIANGKLAARRMGKAGPWFVTEAEVERYRADSLGKQRKGATR